MLELYHDVSVEILYRGDDYWSVVTDKNADLNNNHILIYAHVSVNFVLFIKMKMKKAAMLFLKMS